MIGMLPVIGIGLSGAATVAAGYTMMQKRRKKKREEELAAAMQRAYAARQEQLQRPRGTFVYRPAIRHAAVRRLNHMRGIPLGFSDIEPFIR